MTHVTTTVRKLAGRGKGFVARQPKAVLGSRPGAYDIHFIQTLRRNQKFLAVASPQERKRIDRGLVVEMGRLNQARFVSILFFRRGNNGTLLRTGSLLRRRQRSPHDAATADVKGVELRANQERDGVFRRFDDGLARAVEGRV